MLSRQVDEGDGGRRGVLGADRRDRRIAQCAKPHKAAPRVVPPSFRHRPGRHRRRPQLRSLGRGASRRSSRALASQTTVLLPSRPKPTRRKTCSSMCSWRRPYGVTTHLADPRVQPQGAFGRQGRSGGGRRSGPRTSSRWPSSTTGLGIASSLPPAPTGRSSSSWTSARSATWRGPIPSLTMRLGRGQRQTQPGREPHS